MYVPSIAHRIHQENMKLEASVTDGVDRRYVPLEGIALGNGWVDARVQGPATIDYAYWHGMIDEDTRDNLHAEWTRCQTLKGAYRPNPPFHPFNVPDDCAMMEGVLKAAGAGIFTDADHVNYPLTYGPNTYDITTWDPYGVILDGNTTFNLFFNDDRIKEILHAPLETEWAGCIPGAGRRRRRRLSSDVSSAVDDRQDHHRHLILENDRPISTIPYIAELLDAGIRVLVYNGDRDLSTNAQGSEMLLNSMEWNGMHKWKRADRALWIVKDPDTDQQVVGGYAKELSGLAFVVVTNSGHMVR
jgi:Serine carboxypeptidase